jgi:hypothetical protein
MTSSSLLGLEELLEELGTAWKLETRRICFRAPWMVRVSLQVSFAFREPEQIEGTQDDVEETAADVVEEL